MEQDQETNAYKGLVSKGEEKNGEVKNRGQRGRLVQWYLEEDGELLSSHLKVFKISGDKKKAPAICGNLRERNSWRKRLTANQPILVSFKKYSSSLPKISSLPCL